MGNLKTILLFLLIAAILVAGVLFSLGYFRPGKAGLYIETTPLATVYLNGEQAGRTPYRQTVEPGNVTIKLIPDSFETPLAPFETRVTLISGIETHIKRNFGDSDTTSSGSVVSFEEGLSGETSIAVVSIPDAAEVRIDGSIRGFAPYKTSSVTPGDHQVAVAAPGYLEGVLTVKAIEGYKLTVVTNLAPDPQAQEQETEIVEEELETRVEVQDTPTGFLRVRSSPSTAGEEVGRVTPGETYVLVETDEESGWYKIIYSEDEEGWISDEYANLVEESKETNATPSASLVAN